MEEFPITEMFDAPMPPRGRGRKRIRRDPMKVDGNLVLRPVSPRTENQARAFDHYDAGCNLLLSGSAGTGKTFISLAMAVRSVLRGEAKRVAIVRSAVPTRDIGFLPGSAKEKLAVYEAPYVAIFNELFGRADAYAIMKAKRLVEFVPTSFVRGTTMSDTVVILEEGQNMSFHEIDSVVTRLGEGSRLIACGDFSQSDLTRESERNGMRTFSRIVTEMGSFRTVEFTEDDIVRSGTVREYIVTKNRLGVPSY